MEPEEQRAQVGRVAAELAGVSGEVTLLAGERDVTARVGNHIVKVYAPDSDTADLRLQDAALRHLAGTPAARYVPRVLASSLDDSRTDSVDVLPGPVRILDWLPGSLWKTLERPEPALLHSLGRVVALVDSALADFSHPAQDRRLAWNLLAAPELRDWLDVVTDPARRGLAEKVLRHHSDRLTSVLVALPTQVIHSDANDRNVLVDDGEVCGLIDFGDLVTAPRVCGLAIACAYAAFSQRDPVRDILPLVAGYHEVSPLDPAELPLLLDLMRSRLATSIVMAYRQRLEQPDNDYLMTSQQDAWRVLQLLDAQDETLALDGFRAACSLDRNEG